MKRGGGRVGCVCEDSKERVTYAYILRSERSRSIWGISTGSRHMEFGYEAEIIVGDLVVARS